MLKRAVLTFIAATLAFTGAVGALAPITDDGRVSVPIVMYHSVSRTGGGDYIVSPDVLERDLEYLKARDYSAVFVRDLVDFVENGTPLPEKPVVITFDDGFYNNLVYAVPLLEKYGFKATVSVVGSYVDNERGMKKRSCSYSYLSPRELKNMSDSGVVEIGNHSYDMHRLRGRKGVKKLASESAKEYENALKTDAQKCTSLVREACGAEPEVFAYPFGSYSPETQSIIKSLGYHAALTCAEKVNRLKKGDTERLFWLGRFNRSGARSTKEFFKRMGIK